MFIKCIWSELNTYTKNMGMLTTQEYRWGFIVQYYNFHLNLYGYSNCQPR